MELLRSHLSRVRIPEPSNRIYKEECCISFDTPRSEGGLFVDLNSFLAFGRDHVLLNYAKTGNPVYLNIVETVKPAREDGAHKKPSRLGIGVEGGFDVKGPEYEQSYSIVILPDFVYLPFPNVELPEKVRLCVDGVLAAMGAEHKEDLAAWTADKKKESIYARELQQLDNGVKVPPHGWKCSLCDKRENLWLNLTDGSILCGRRNWDGTGGNDHAAQHYSATGHPLAVKLGTVTADLDAADVYSYPEDAAVEDPLLAQHLHHFGIDFSSLTKTEMTTAERELDQNVNFDWNRIQEKGKELEPLFGPGYTGLANLGNSCYLASVVQVVFSTKSFQQQYYDRLNLDDAFRRAPADPTLDLNTQLAKLAHGILSGRYSFPVTKPSVIEVDKEEVEDDKETLGQAGIPPRMFKALIGAGHPEFATSRQQDALEFFQHLIQQVEENFKTNPQEDPSRAFKFVVEDRIQCSASGNVKYTRKTDNVLSLSIPLHAAVNKGSKNGGTFLWTSLRFLSKHEVHSNLQKCVREQLGCTEEVAAYEKTKSEKSLVGEKLTDEEIVRPRVPLYECLHSFSAPEEVQDFHSTAINAKTTALKTAGLATFPDYLLLHMRKFVLDDGWVPRKLDVFIDVPDEIDISYMRSRGFQPGEELLPETGENPEPAGPVADESIVEHLVVMGFPRVHCEKAAINTSNRGVEEAMTWLLSHMDDPDIDEPIRGGSQPGRSREAPVDQRLVDTLISFGFEPDVAIRALRATGGDVERATEWIFSQPPDAVAMELDSSSAADAPAVDQGLPDGPGKYQLLAFVSHMGSSVHSGHYVAHVKKDGRWVLFNDSKVAVSGDPPRDLGYLYLFQRDPSVANSAGGTWSP